MTNIVPPLQRMFIADPATGDPVSPDDFGGGQVVAVGAGATDPSTTRVRLASDDPLLGYVDGLETLITSLNGYVDGLEALQTAANALLTTEGGYLDGVETLLTQLKTQTALAAGENNVGIVGGHTPRCTATFTTAADASAYAAGDLIANSTTAASVVPLTFDVTRTGALINSGRVFSVRGVVTPASSNLVITALDFDLLLFRPETNIPFAAGSYPASNAALTVSAAMYRELIGIFRFYATGWRSPAGSVVTAGVTGYQRGTLSVPFAPYNLASMGGTTLLGLVQAQSAWAPGAIAQQFDFALDLDQD